jgi:hypothetical protein
MCSIFLKAFLSDIFVGLVICVVYTTNSVSNYIHICLYPTIYLWMDFRIRSLIMILN